MGESSPLPGVSPSLVVTSDPWAWTANIRHDRTASPSTSTVHAPHTPCSHPRWVPVRVQSSRMKSARVLRGSMNARRTVPLTLTLTGTSGTRGLLECGADCSGDHLHDHALPVPAAGVDVVGGIETLGLGLGHLSKGVEAAVASRAREGGFHGGGLQWRAPDPNQPDARPPDLAAAVQLDGDGRARQGEVAVAAGHLLDSKARLAGPYGEVHGRQHIVGLHRGRPRGGEEI